MSWRAWGKEHVQERYQRFERSVPVSRFLFGGFGDPHKMMEKQRATCHTLNPLQRDTIIVGVDITDGGHFPPPGCNCTNVGR